MPLKKQHALPVEGKHKEFCEYMGYELMDEKGQFSYYYIPSGHICRFTINFKRWEEGNFNKDHYLDSLRRG